MSPKPTPPRDQVIGVAFWRSVKVFGVLIALVLASVLGVKAFELWFSPKPEVVTEDAFVDLSGLLDQDDGVMPTPANFVDITKASGIDFVHHNGAFGERLLPETMGGGVAFLDYDNDGDQDLLFVNGSDWPFMDSPDIQETVVLYANNGQGVFRDVTPSVGLSGLDAYGMGVAVGDYDGNGWVDVFITAVGRNHLFSNRDGQFTDVTTAAGVSGENVAWSTGAAFFDANNDGLLDLYVANYVVWSRAIDIEVDYRLTGIGRAYGPPSNFQGRQPYFYINQGDGTFIEASKAAGLVVTHPTTGLGVGKGLAVIATDINQDEKPDLIVANDTTRNFVYLNDTSPNDPQNVRFTEVGTELGIGFDRNGMATGAMGIDFAHYKNDDAFSVAIGNFANEMSSFYVSAGIPVQFNDQSIGVGIGGPTRLALTFGVFFFDYDLDGRLDYLQANGHVEDEINRVQSSQTHEQSAQLFWNCGSACARPYVALGTDQMGALSQPMVGRGAAYADIDSDGRLDVVLTQIAGPPMLLRNETVTNHHWIGFDLKGKAPNTSAIGAKVIIERGEERLIREVSPTRSYLSQMALPVHFGLGDTPEYDSIVIQWPDGSTQSLLDLPVDQYHIIHQYPPKSLARALQ